jgi:DNA ligase-1
MKSNVVKYQILFIFILYCLPILFLLVEAKTPPELLLAKTYRTAIEIKHYLVSEKLDGVRAYWDGKQFLPRQGNQFNAPDWFIKNFPNYPLDGELWIARNHFQQTVSTVRKKQPIDTEWQRISYQLFELPNATGSFQQRVEKMSVLVKQLAIPHLKVIDQYRLENTKALDDKLNEVIAQGAEGLMLHRADALYQSGRSNILLKVKKHQDAEATVIQHLAGKGKFSGLLGSVVVKDNTGRQFKLGTGFSLKQRQNPPAVGTLITYKYFGRTKKGLPRFASFLRVRD